ncbi:hypothetical protein GV794_05975 [Nocardia cyriacigeorgica]|uniref:Uncharacterized protein n=1 Tax=Nocardia cyriacigeorgica TaxID=135487 RepID=A0ABX0CGE3_9NOCA|nr:hypothetical protein [Nocardia cyriacigeorgica]NEW52943.1 hypothetical protein [Nocardia cyriacigeorgica]NEW55209.1 hypothetical protein [Nocardia cyriacigeorgica]
MRRSRIDRHIAITPTIRNPDERREGVVPGAMQKAETASLLGSTGCSGSSLALSAISPVRAVAEPFQPDREITIRLRDR